MSVIFLLITEYEFMPNHNLVLTGIHMLECEPMPTVTRIALSPLHVFEKRRQCFAYAEEYLAGGFGGGFAASAPQIKVPSFAYLQPDPG